MNENDDCSCEECTGLFVPRQWHPSVLPEYGILLTWRLMKAFTDTTERVLDDVLRHRSWVLQQQDFTRSVMKDIDDLTGGSNG